MAHEYYLPKTTKEQRAYLISHYSTEDWKDGSINVIVNDFPNEVDKFIDWCEQQNLNPELK